MRNRVESPLLMLGVAAVGVAVGVALSSSGRRRQGSFLGGLLDSVSGFGGDALSAVSATASKGYDAVSSGVSGALDGSGRKAEGGRVSSFLSSVPGAVGEGVGSAVSGLAEVLSSVWEIGKEKLGASGEAVSNGAARARDAVGESLRQVSWRDVQEQAKRAVAAEDEDGSHVPLVSAGAALVLIGGAVYLLALSPGAEDRRREWGQGLQKVIGDVGQFSLAAGKQFGGAGKGPQWGYQEGGQDDPSRATPTEHPAVLANRIQEIIEQTTSDRSDVHVVIREGVVVLQGAAAPEEYDALVRAVSETTHSFVNELQAVAV